MKRVPAAFFRTEAGNEPVRDWLKSLSSQDRRRIGEDIKTVEFGWPIGMPTVGLLAADCTKSAAFRPATELPAFSFISTVSSN